MPTSTSAPPSVRSTLAAKPLNIAPMPSSLTILMAQSTVPLYSHCSLGLSDCICRRRRTVSNGYEMKPATMAVNCAMQNLEKRPTKPLSFLNGFFSFRVSYTPKYGPRYATMPTTDTPKPLYIEKKPPPEMVLVRQSKRPENCGLPEPTSEARRVRA